MPDMQLIFSRKKPGEIGGWTPRKPQGQQDLPFSTQGTLGMTQGTGIKTFARSDFNFLFCFWLSFRVFLPNQGINM